MTKLSRYSQGFSLVEIMIGLVIGLLATLVIVNVFSVFEQQKRATTGTADAQTNGAIALYNIQRDSQQAGFGLPVYDSDFSPYKCGTANDATAALRTPYDHDSNPGTDEIDLSPAVIRDGGINGSDTLSLRGSNIVNNLITPNGGVSITVNALNADNVVSGTTLGCAENDTVLIQNITNLNTPRCNLRRVSGNPQPTSINFTPNLLNMATSPARDLKFACIGRWEEVTYAINANELIRAGVPLVTEIVSMQAQYGISAPITAISNNNQVTQWVNATGEWANINNAATRNRIKAIRVAVVARNGLIEPTDVTTMCSSLTAPAPTGLCAWAGTADSPAPSINLATTDPNWRRYRYRVFETVIPLRNVIFSRDLMKP